MVGFNIHNAVSLWVYTLEDVLGLTSNGEVSRVVDYRPTLNVHYPGRVYELCYCIMHTKWASELSIVRI